MVGKPDVGREAWIVSATEVTTIVERVEAERRYQDGKWGGPANDDRHSNGTWSLIMGAEEGEVAEAALALTWIDSRQRREALIHELVQVSAVAQAWAEAVQRQLDALTDQPPEETQT